MYLEGNSIGQGSIQPDHSYLKQPNVVYLYNPHYDVQDISTVIGWFPIAVV